MPSSTILRSLVPLLLFAPGAFSGTLITTNLSPGSAILNISGTGDGAAAFNGNQSLWFRPFTTGGNPFLEYTFQPGTYGFRVINQSDAAALFPALTPAQLGLIGGAWTYNSPWATDYLAFDQSAASDPTEAQLFTGAVINPTVPVPGSTGFVGGGYDNQPDAYQAALLGGYYNQIISGSPGRYGGTVSNTFTFTSPTTLIFAVPDYFLPDNNGTVSVLVTSDASSTVPEPVSGVMVCGAMGLLALCYRRRNL